MHQNNQLELTMALVGAGRVATHLAHAFQSFAPFKLIYSRTFANSSGLAQTLDATVTEHIQDLLSVDIIFICVSDDQIAAVATELADLDYHGLVVHTSGATPLSVLTHLGLRAGVFYPVQSFSLNQRIDWYSTPILIEAPEQLDRERLSHWAQHLSQQVFHYSSSQRAMVHLAAVFACNFSNFCIDIAQQLLTAHDMEFQLLLPLILNTVQKLTFQSAFTNQTGPAARADTITIQRHQTQLELMNQLEFLQVYQLMTALIMQRHHQSKMFNAE